MDRVRTKIEDLVDRLTSAPFAGDTVSWEQAASQMLAAHRYSASAGPGVIERILSEPELQALERDLLGRIQELAGDGPFRLSHNADFGLARLCYLACRAFRPSVVVETGVCYGVISSFILTALSKNESGVLHSVDLPPLARGAQAFVGILIPEGVRNRWQLHRGAVRRVLPGLLASLGEVNMFVHDSLHTYSTMSFEFSMVGRYLAKDAVVIADDVAGNMAFSLWLKNAKARFSAVVRETDKESTFGVSLIR
jgi:hypothetical protein